ncbi:glycosyltransferase family 39 protein [Actinosynnema sp. NPDC059335]|uniref:glycosyltransferase family 39 protein n=1 Tax=Actinosynnema sp. NPDC059335 TaxID=3346804 RepID=UPI00366FCCFB
MPALALRPLTVLGAAVGVLLLAVSGRYGYFGDELYHVAAGRHLDWGFADQGPLTPLLAHAVDALFPGSVVALRAPAALLAAGLVVLTGATARELGGGHRAQLLAAAACAVSATTLLFGHVTHTVIVDLFCWTLLGWLPARWVRTRDDRLLLWCGVVVAVAVQNKWLIVAFCAAFAVVVPVVGPRGLLRTPWAWAGAAVAALSAAPGVLWQAAHGWPQLTLSSALGRQPVFGMPPWLPFLPMLLLYSGLLFGGVLLVHGWVRLLRSPGLADHRFLGWVAVVVTVIFLVSGGRYYYASGLVPLLWAAGGVELERRRPAAWWRWTTTWPVAVLCAAVAVAQLPLPPRDRLPATDFFGRYSTGWPELADRVDAAYRALTPDERRHAVVVADTYFLAGAVEVLATDVPAVYSPHRGYADFGTPPEGADVVVHVGGDEESLRRHFDRVRLLTVVENPSGVPGTNDRVPLYRCDGPKRSWSSLWAELRGLV